MPSFRTYAGRTISEVLEALGSTPMGLSGQEARRRLAANGPNRLLEGKEGHALSILARQFASPLTLLLVFAALIALVTRAYADSVIVLGIVALSIVLSFAQEFRAARAVAALSARVVPRARVIRSGERLTLPTHELVIGDVVLLSAGSLVPADALILESNGCLVDEAILTGETFPSTKRPATFAADAPLARCSGAVFAGTNVRSGTASAVVVATGMRTELGRVAREIEKTVPETEFERGIREFGVFISKIVAFLVGVVFVLDVLTQKAPIESLLFAIAIAVGMAPELLPAVVTLALSRGARHMASCGVIVRRLSAIENLGSIDVLCTDKTGTLTEGVVTLEGAMDAAGQNSDRPFALAYVNARHQSGFANPIDEAIVSLAEKRGLTAPSVQKLGEVPYDFTRKRLGVAYKTDEGEARIVVKGAFEHVLEACTLVRFDDRVSMLDENARRRLRAVADDAASRGLRTLGVADGVVGVRDHYEAGDERGLVFEGYLLFADPPKAGVAEVLAELRAQGVSVKIITGDGRAAARHLAERVGIRSDAMMVASEIAALSDSALDARIEQTDLFAETDPGHKERIVHSLRRAGHCVGFLGDGINDAPALHAADVGVSVDSAVDVAKASADLVLLRRDLAVLRDGIVEGRRTFSNTMKYIYTTTSANFGNMLSLACASAFLPFLPLLAKQVLLNNLLSDVPAMTIAGDSVDRELVARPRRFDVVEIRRFMIAFGTVSSLFDGVTFMYLQHVAKLSPDGFRTGWFVESLLTELLIVFVVRTRRPLLGSRPSAALSITSVAIAALVIALPYSPLATTFSLIPLRPDVMSAVVGISLVYALVSEATKHRFWRGDRCEVDWPRARAQS